MKKVILILNAWLFCFCAVAQDRIFENTLADKPHIQAFSTSNNTQEVSLYPNPSPGRVVLSLSGFKGKRIQVRVSNVIGNVVFQETFNQTDDQVTKVLNLSTFNKGLYYVKVESEKFNQVKKVYII